MILNKKMEELLEEIKISYDYRLKTEEIQEKFCSRFIEWDGCILVQVGSNLVELPERFEPNIAYIDKTQFEATYNHIHLLDILPELDNPKQSLIVALELIEIWEHKLKTKYPEEKFQFVVSHDEFGSTIRFYKIRPSETPWININCIENCQEEAILVKVI